MKRINQRGGPLILVITVVCAACVGFLIAPVTVPSLMGSAVDHLTNDKKRLAKRIARTF